MHWLRWVVVILALLDAGYMTVDGARALLTGDYITPKTGEYAGQLGPWTQLVRTIGIEPRSTLMKSLFTAYGVIWLIITFCFALKFPWAWWAMLLAAVGSLWYLWIGTLSSIIQIMLLLLLAARPTSP